MSKAFRTNALIITILLVLVVVGVSWSKHRSSPTSTPTTATQVVLTTPRTIMLSHRISSSGNLEAIQTANLSAKISGYVTHIYYTEGTAVKAGAVLIQLDDSKEQAAVDSARAQDASSALKYRQFSKIYRQHFASYDDYFDAKINHEKDHAALETAQTDLLEKRIRAPFTGITGAKLLSVGDLIQPGTTLLTLTDLTHLRVTYSVPAGDMDLLKLNQPVTISTFALHNALFHGVISYISPTVDASSQTVTVHADIDNAQQLLKPGLFVNIHQSLTKPVATLVIPADALFASINGYYVLGVKKGKAYSIPVTIGAKLNQGVVITHGLTATDHFIAQGQTKVQVGDFVTELK